MIRATIGILAGSAGGFDADYQAVLDYATTKGYTLPSASQQILQNQLVVDLKNAGVWSKLDIFALFATDGNSDFALIDWKRLTDCTAINSPSFTTNEGFEGDGLSAYIDTNWNIANDSVNFQQNDAGFFVATTIQDSTTGGSDNNRYIGVSANNYNSMRVDVNDISGSNRVWVSSTDDTSSAFNAKVNDTIYFGNRTASASTNTRNTVLPTNTTYTITDTSVSEVLPSTNQLILLGVGNYANPGNRVSMVGFGSNLNSTEMDDICTAYYTNYYTSL